MIIELEEAAECFLEMKKRRGFGTTTEEIELDFNMMCRAAYAASLFRNPFKRKQIIEWLGGKKGVHVFSTSIETGTSTSQVLQMCENHAFHNWLYDWYDFEQASRLCYAAIEFLKFVDSKQKEKTQSS